LRAPAHDADLGVALVIVGGDHQRPAAVAEAGILAAGQAGGADLGVAYSEGWNLQRFIDRLAFGGIDDLDIDFVQLERGLELLVAQQLALRHRPPSGYRLDADDKLTDDQKGWTESFRTLRNGAQETGTANR
jgi:hypothetical protein